MENRMNEFDEAIEEEGPNCKNKKTVVNEAKAIAKSKFGLGNNSETTFKEKIVNQILEYPFTFFAVIFSVISLVYFL